MKLDKKTILITGGAGFIGSHVVRGFLATNRYKIMNVDLLTYAGNLSSLEDVDSVDYIFEQRDIRNFTTISQLFEKYKPDGVLHLAAEPHVDRSIDSPGGKFDLRINDQVQESLDGIARIVSRLVGCLDKII